MWISIWHTDSALVQLRHSKQCCIMSMVAASTAMTAFTSFELADGCSVSGNGR